MKSYPLHILITDKICGVVKCVKYKTINAGDL